MQSHNNTVDTWFTMIREGLLTLPRFQREEAWKPAQITGVLENMLRVSSLPIGSLLVLEVGDKEKFHARPIATAPNKKVKPRMHLLDGQQRMTAIWRSLNGSYDDITAFVSLENEDQPEVKIIKRYRNKSNKMMPSWAENPQKCLEKKLVPAKVLLPGSEGEVFKRKWVKKACPDDSEKGWEVSDHISELRQRVGKYNIPYLQLPEDTKRDTAIDIFITMNTSSSPLRDFDIVVAQVEDKKKTSLHKKISELKKRVPEAKEYGNVESMALAIGAMQLDKPALKSTYLGEDFGKNLMSKWKNIEHGMIFGLGFLRDEMFFTRKQLPTEIIVTLASALWANIPVDGADEEGRARTQIRKAIWRASFTDRYEKAATTRTFADYKAILSLIKNPGATETEKPDLFNDKENWLPKVDELVTGRWPRNRDRLGRAIMAVSLYKGGYDFADGAKAAPKNIGSREYHHIYPKKFISEKNYTDQEINSALNCALISWKTNRKISARSPKQYIKERAQDARATEKQVKQRLNSHLIPYDELIGGNFGEFLSARAKRIHEAMLLLVEGSVPQ